MLDTRYFTWDQPAGRQTVSDYLIQAIAGDKTTLLRASATSVVTQAMFTALVLVIVYRYFQECSDDRREKRVAVSLLAITTVAQLILTNVDFGLLITHRDDYAKVYNRDLMISAIGILLGSFSVFQLHLSFNCRTYFLCGRKKWLAILLGLFIMTSLVLSVVAFIYAAAFTRYGSATTISDILNDLTNLQTKTNRLTLISKLHISITLLTNLLITGFISTALWRCRTGFGTTDSLVKRLFVQVVGRMVPPVALAAAHAGMLYAGVGIGSWLRVTSGLQTPVCCYTVVTVLLLRVRKSTRYAFPETRQYQEKSGTTATASATALHSTSLGSKVLSVHSPDSPFADPHAPMLITMAREVV